VAQDEREQSPRRWRGIKQRLHFAQVTQDGDDEGILLLDRLPTAAEAVAIRETLRIRRRRHVAPEAADRLISYRYKTGVPGRPLRFSPWPVGCTCPTPERYPTDFDRPTRRPRVGHEREDIERNVALAERLLSDPASDDFIIALGVLQWRVLGPNGEQWIMLARTILTPSWAVSVAEAERDAYQGAHVAADIDKHLPKPRRAQTVAAR
jgi:hypothetical protein